VSLPLVKGRTADIESSVTTAKECMKHSNAAVYLVQGRVDSRHADTSN